MMICHECYVDRRAVPRLALVKQAMWIPGSTISVGFIGGTDKQRTAVIEHMSEWTEYANINLVFSKHGDSTFGHEVRVSFVEGKGSWSYVGAECRYVDSRKPTMNFGWLTSETRLDKWRATILHESGHMLGAIHEHQSPAAKIPWNKKAVYSYYWNAARWSKAKVDTNIFKRYGNEVTNSKFDPESIMLYSIPASLTDGNYHTDWNSDLSEGDKEFISRMYPR